HCRRTAFAPKRQGQPRRGIAGTGPAVPDYPRACPETVRLAIRLPGFALARTKGTPPFCSRAAIDQLNCLEGRNVQRRAGVLHQNMIKYGWIQSPLTVISRNLRIA